MTKVSINLSAIIITAIIIISLALVGWKIYSIKVGNLKTEVKTETNLRDALLDSISNYKNKEKEWVSEKLTIQETIKNLNKDKDQLTTSQLEMIKRIKEIEKTNDIIAAALIQTHVKLDSILHKGSTIVDVPNNKVIFKDKFKNGNKEFNYGLTVGNVIPSPVNAKPTLLIDSLYFPNKQFVEFHWKNDAKKGYPISFSVSNSNDFFKTANIDSYAIPALNKTAIDPNGWQKIGKFFTKNSTTVIYIGVGMIAGAGLYWYATK